MKLRSILIATVSVMALTGCPREDTVCADVFPRPLVLDGRILAFDDPRQVGLTPEEEEHLNALFSENMRFRIWRDSRLLVQRASGIHEKRRNWRNMSGFGCQTRTAEVAHPTVQTAKVDIGVSAGPLHSLENHGSHLHYSYIFNVSFDTQDGPKRERFCGGVVDRSPTERLEEIADDPELMAHIVKKMLWMKPGDSGDACEIPRQGGEPPKLGWPLELPDVPTARDHNGKIHGRPD